MKNLQQRLLELTTKNTVKSGKSHKSISDYMIEVFNDKKPRTRVELTAEISARRYESLHGEITEKTMNSPEFLEEFTKLNTTVKNGIDTSISKNNREDHEEYPGYILIVEAGKYNLIQK